MSAEVHDLALRRLALKIKLCRAAFAPMVERGDPITLPAELIESMLGDMEIIVKGAEKQTA